MQLLATLILCFTVLLAFAQQGENKNAQGNEDPRIFKHPLTDMPSQSEDISTSFYFPSHGDLKLPIGEVVTTLCHFGNKGASYYNISAIMGSLNSPYDFRHHFQNYSYKPIGMVVKSDEEITMQYSFQLHPDLEPVDYQLSITVFYESETEAFSTTFFNQTVELYSPQADYDLETVSLVIYSFLSTVLVGLIVLYACFPELQTSQKIGTLLKKYLPASVTNTKGKVGQYDSEDDWTVVQHKNNKKQRNSSKDEDNEEAEEQ
eukprot:gene4559-4888_t